MFALMQFWKPCQYGKRRIIVMSMCVLKLLSTTAQLRRSLSVLNDCVKFNIFGSVHAMKTEIPPFDSKIKDSTNSSL